MKRMKTKLVALLFGVGLMTAVLSGSAFAASSNHTQPGTPGTPGCAGQTTAFIAQLAQNQGAPIPPGLGNFAKLVGASPSEIHALVQQYCSTGP